MKVTRVAYSHRLNAGKYAALQEQAARLGRVRSAVWQRYASVGGAGLRDRQVRDAWLADGTHRQFGVLANAWKETVRDAMADIAANRETAKVAVKRAIRRHTSDEAERKRLYTELKAGRWAADAYLARQMRRHWRRGHNRTHDQIVVRADQHNTITDGHGRLWLAVPGRIQRKADRIRQHNLGKLKRERRRARWQAQVRTETFTAVHRVIDKAGTVVAEDLTKTFAGRRQLGKNMNRRLAAWTKGVTVHTPHQTVLQIVQERADRHRTRLPVQDSSGPRSTESETSINAHAQV